MNRPLDKTSLELTMAAHTKIIQAIVKNCYELVNSNYDNILRYRYDFKDPWSITIEQFNQSTMDLAMRGEIWGIVYMFPNDDSLNVYNSATKTNTIFNIKRIYDTLQILKHNDGEDTNSTYTIENIILNEEHIDDDYLCQLINTNTLRLIHKLVDLNTVDNGLTINTLLLATNLEQQLEIAIHFYTTMMSPDGINQHDVYVEDALSIVSWMNQINSDLQKIPVGRILLNDGTSHNVYVSANIAAGISQYNDHNRIQVYNQNSPALYIIK